MERDPDPNDAGQFEWVNTWAQSAKAERAVVAPALSPATPSPDAMPPQPVIAPAAPALPGDQLLRDIAEIERARVSLAAVPVGNASQKRTQALTLVPPRTSDFAPVVIGGVLAMVMLTVFGAAAAMTKLSR